MRISALLGLAVLTACEAPLVFPGADKRQNSSSARIEGDVVVSSTARGNVVLFLYDAARPPPPAGTGRPLTFTVVSRDAVFGGAVDGDSGPFTAPFAFSLVAPGRYLIRGFVDADADFVPWYGVTADVTQGDVGGGAVDAMRALKVIEVGTDANGAPVAAVNVPVSISDAARVPADRPAFSIGSGAESVIIGATPQLIELVPTPLVDGVIQQNTPAFLLRLVDDNGDGAPDDANGDGTPDIWPRVVVRKLAGDSPLLDENDLDKNGVIDAEGVDYEHLNTMTGAPIEPDGKPDLVVLAAGFDFSEYAAQLVDGSGRVRPQPTPVPRLRLVLQPRAIDASNPSALQVLRTVPSGRYAITVIQLTGQTWRVPNELTPGIAENVGLPVIASQSFVVLVP